MNIRRTLIAFFFLFPIVIIAFLVMLHKKRFPEESKIKISPVQFSETQKVWSSQKFTDITNNEDFFKELLKEPIVKNNAQVEDYELDSLQKTIKNLVLANYSGDYDIYKHFRMPVTNYDVPDINKGWVEWFHLLFPQKETPSSFDSIEYQIWNHFFSGHPYWLKISLSSVEISLLETNHISKMFGFEYSAIKAKDSFGGASDGSISYANYLIQIQKKYPNIVFARVGFVVDTVDPFMVARPFCYVFALDRDKNVWLPIHIIYMSAKPYSYNPPF